MKSPTKTQLFTPSDDDRFLHTIEHWKKRALALFSLVAIIIAIVVVLLIEIASLVEVFQLKFSSALPCGRRAVFRR